MSTLPLAFAIIVVTACMKLRPPGGGCPQATGSQQSGVCNSQPDGRVLP